MSFIVDQELSCLQKGPITRDHLRAYAAASGDSNPIHLVDSFAQEAGFPSVIAHGMLSMAFLGDYLRGQFPANQYRIARFRTRFRKVTFPGDTLTCSARIKDVREDGSLLVLLALSNQSGEVTTDGEAEIFPQTSI